MSVKRVTVEFQCPECGADGYEEEFNAEEVTKAAQVSFTCDECPATISLSVDAHLYARTTGTASTSK